MKIIKAEYKDLIPVMDTVGACVAHLREQGIYQWNEMYPTEKVLEEDIREGTLYIVKYGETCRGMVVLNQVHDTEWKNAHWSEDCENPLCVHRLIVHPEWQNQGVGRALMEFAHSYAVDNNHDCIRFDAYSGNPPLVETYQRMGCKKTGEAIFPYRELPFWCYEMMVERKN